MHYLSVCSGIESASVAWKSLGWNPLAFSEVETFPSKVLEHHYPLTPNLGDMTKYKEWSFNASVDLVVGGTLCQSFSVSGLRRGLEDPRGNLALAYVGILDQFKPTWCIWENVPGVLSSNGGKDFSALLSALVDIGYGFAYRVLDAQYFGVPQRRRRLFLVGCLRGWESATQVLFEQGCYPRDSQKIQSGIIRGTGKTITGCLSTRVGAYDRQDLDILIYDYQNKTVRNLMPVECERLQGFPDGYTDIKGATDAKRYKAIGNSMAVPVMKWIGQRIDLLKF
jgi:DNA (cytosine-5)-methyltransferase 1